MATNAYYAWVAAGRKWTLAQPIADLVAWASRNGITILGTIGNEAHLTADRPQDHTPFSVTAWPVPLDGYKVCAIDLDPRRGQGALILRDARAGRTPWLKYLNTGGRQYHCRDGFQSSVYNSDTHDHLSVRTDFQHASISTYDPFDVTGESDMDENQNRLLENVERILTTGWEGKPAFGVDYGGAGIQPEMPNPFTQIKEQISTLQLGGVDVAALAEALKPHLVAAAKAAVLDPAVLAEIGKAVSDEDHKRSAA